MKTFRVLLVVLVLSMLAGLAPCDTSGEAIFRPRPTRTPRVTRTPIATLTPTFTPEPTITQTPTPIFTSTFTPEPVFLDVPLFAVPAENIPDREALSEHQLLSSDIILLRTTAAQYFDDFIQEERSMLFTINQDGYPSNLPAAISALLALADQYEVTTLSYNLEWPLHTLQEKIDRLAAVRGELNYQGNERPLIFGPVFSDFWYSYQVFAPYIDGFAIQLQRAPVGNEAYLATQSIAMARTILENPIMYFQISAQATGDFARTPEQVKATIEEMNQIDGVSFINLYFTEWWLVEEVFETIRPVR